LAFPIPLSLWQRYYHSHDTERVPPAMNPPTVYGCDSERQRAG
jgi:hypothetical protein